MRQTPLMVRGVRTTAVTAPHPAKKKEKETGMVVTIPGGILAMVKGEKVGEMEKARVAWDGKVGRGRGRRGKAREGSWNPNGKGNGKGTYGNSNSQWNGPTPKPNLPQAPNPPTSPSRGSDAAASSNQTLV